ncbi:MAG: 23S rRNA (adenine(2503)-C(2))-methyltransferase RlmN [candidate division Zixibacteria bacterium]|nr:23S rRNA (adenine(2503)-C(2))-methyltransferase RlmN [candidate division Zixibacteria bacterium]
MKKNLCGYTRSEIEQLLTELGKKTFHGRQLYKWMYKNLVFDFEEMTDLSKDIRAVLSESYRISLPAIANRQKSGDGTEKFLFELDDGQYVESVLIPDDNSGRMTLCVSSQVGCALGCEFCATGRMGFIRDLTIGEIIAQPMTMRKLYGENAFDNMVFMGMGEPLLNYDNVMAAIDILTDSLGMMLGAKRITISTSGVARGIRKLANSGSKVKLAISLHASNNKLRRRLMPIANSYKLPDLMDAIKTWTSVYARRVTFEYILFKGVNDSKEHALELAKLIKGIPCKINLLSYNLVEGLDFERPSDEEVDAFAKILYPRAPAVTVRKSRGKDIDAACGQLAGRKNKS